VDALRFLYFAGQNILFFAPIFLAHKTRPIGCLQTKRHEQGEFLCTANSIFAHIKKYNTYNYLKKQSFMDKEF